MIACNLGVDLNLILIIRLKQENFTTPVFLKQNPQHTTLTFQPFFDDKFAFQKLFVTFSRGKFITYFIFNYLSHVIHQPSLISSENYDNNDFTQNTWKARCHWSTWVLRRWIACFWTDSNDSPTGVCFDLENVHLTAFSTRRKLVKAEGSLKNTFENNFQSV